MLDEIDVNGGTCEQGAAQGGEELHALDHAVPSTQGLTCEPRAAMAWATAVSPASFSSRR
jgi:hypothetical protein